jgi:hypothetical protein
MFFLFQRLALGGGLRINNKNPKKKGGKRARSFKTMARGLKDREEKNPKGRRSFKPWPEGCLCLGSINTL